MPGVGRLDLPDGRAIDFKLRQSSRARSIWLRINGRDGLVVTVPKGVSQREVMALLTRKAEWIARHWTALNGINQRHAEAVTARPLGFDLPALGESWEVEYRDTPGCAVTARTPRAGLILIAGAVADQAACRAALRRWLMRHAGAALAPLLDQLARETGLVYSNLSVRNQRARWGSCTQQGRISLNCKLLFLPRAHLRYVMLHELCHTREHNHSQRFWALARQHEPNIATIHQEMRDAWKQIPAWADAG